MLQFWFNTGLHPGELMALRWHKIDWVNPEAMGGLIAQKSATFLANDHVWHNPRTSAPWETDAQIRKTLW